MRLKNSSINSLVGVITLFILSIFGFVVTKIFVANLGVEFNGLNGLFTNIISILSITELGLGSAISFNLYKPLIDNDTEKIKSIMLFFKKCYKIIGITIFSLSLVVSLFIPYIIKESTLSPNYIRFIFLLFAFNSSISYFFSYRRCLFYADQKEYINTLIDFLMKLVKHILQIIVLIYFKSFVVFLLVNIIVTFINNIFIYFKSIRSYPNITVRDASRDREVEKLIINSVKSLAIIQVLNSFISFTDNIIISAVISISVAGLYTNYHLIISELNQVITIIYNGLGASIGHLVAEGNKRHIKEIFYNLDYLSFFLGAFCCCSLYIIMEPFISYIWLGEEYLLSNTCLLLMAINFYLIIIKQPKIYFLKNSGNFKSLILPFALEAPLNVVGSIILAKFWGLTGILFMTFIASLISYGIITYRTAKIFDIKKDRLFRDQVIFFILVMLEIVLLKFIMVMVHVKNGYLVLVMAVFLALSIPNIVSLIIVFKNKSLEYLQNIIINITDKFLKRKVEVKNE